MKQHISTLEIEKRLLEKEIQKTNKARFIARDQVNFGDGRNEVSYVNCNSHNVPTKKYRENLLFAMGCTRDTHCKWQVSVIPHHNPCHNQS